MDQKLQVLVSSCVQPRNQKFENIPLLGGLVLLLKKTFCVHCLMLVSLIMTKETNESRSHCWDTNSKLGFKVHPTTYHISNAQFNIKKEPWKSFAAKGCMKNCGLGWVALEINMYRKTVPRFFWTPSPDDRFERFWYQKLHESFVSQFLIAYHFYCNFIQS